MLLSGSKRSLTTPFPQNHRHGWSSKVKQHLWELRPGLRGLSRLVRSFWKELHHQQQPRERSRASSWEGGSRQNRPNPKWKRWLQTSPKEQLLQTHQRSWKKRRGSHPGSRQEYMPIRVSARTWPRRRRLILRSSWRCQPTSSRSLSVRGLTLDWRSWFLEQGGRWMQGSSVCT